MGVLEYGRGLRWGSLQPRFLPAKPCICTVDNFLFGGTGRRTSTASRERYTRQGRRVVPKRERQAIGGPEKRAGSKICIEVVG